MILGAATQGATKTRLMYSAFLSYAQIVEYLAFLQEKGLLMYVEGLQQYKLTEKGLQFLHSYDQISEILAVGKAPRATESAQLVAPVVREW